MKKNAGNILIVDQDSELVAILSAFLSSLNYKVVFTTRIREALNKVENAKFVHIFLEPELPPDDSISLLADLTGRGTLNSKTPLTLMPSNRDFLVPFRYARRINSILVKPFTLDEFAFHLTDGVKRPPQNPS